MMLAFHWPNQVLLAGAGKGPMMLAHWRLTWAGVQILIGPMKNSQSWANDVGTLAFDLGRCANSHWANEKQPIMGQ